MTEIHCDIRGTYIVPGDFIVYAALMGRSPVLKYGIVTRLAERDQKWSVANPVIPVLKVITADYGYRGEWGLQKKGAEITLGFVNRIFVVRGIDVPGEVEDMLLQGAKAKGYDFTK